MLRIFSFFFLGIAVIFIVVFIVLAPEKPQDAQNYILQNPNCEENPKHAENQSLLKCIWSLESPSDFPDLQDNSSADSVLLQMVKFLAERHKDEYPLRVSKVFFYHSAAAETLGISGNSINLLRVKNSYFVNLTAGCEFPSFCPQKNFRDSMVYAVSAGRVLEIADSPFAEVKIYHGENIYTTTSGFKLNGNLQVGDIISDSSVIGYLSPQDSSRLRLEIVRGGKYISETDLF